MSLISMEIPGLYNGVSQQAPAIRLATQCEYQENILSSLTNGIEARPPTEWVTKLVGSKAGQYTYFYLYSRAPGVNYMVCVTGDVTEPIEIYRCETGQKCVIYYGIFSANWSWVHDSSYKSYVAGCPYPDAYIRCLGIADTILLLNRQVVTSPDEYEEYETPNNYSLIWVKQVQPKIAWEVACNGGYTQIKIGDNGMPTQEMAHNIANFLRGAGGRSGTFTLGPVVVASPGAPFIVNDGWGGRNVTMVMNNQAQKFADLPPMCADGFRVKVIQDDASDFDSYYVQFQAEVGSPHGRWVESRGWWLKNRFNARTLPHRLVRLSDTSFAFCPCNWPERLVGDNVTSPEPSFLWKGIWDMFMWRGRLGFISGENIVMSRAADFFNLYPKTALNILDDDPIDVACATQNVVNLRAAIPFEKRLIALADDVQFTVSGDASLTPETIAVDTVTHYPNDLFTNPVACGSALYFLSPTYQNNKIREMMVQQDTLVTDAADITGHVPRYLPPNTGVLIPVPTQDMVLFHPFLSEPNSLYVYRFYWEGNKKLMSSWSKWTFDVSVLGCRAFGDTIWMVVKRNDEVHLEKLILDNPLWNVHLDRRCVLTGTYNAALDETFFNLPYADSSSNFTIIAGSPTLVRQAVKTSWYQIKVAGNHGGIPFYVGKPYSSIYRFTEPCIRDSEGVATIDGMLQLRTMTLSLSDTQYLRVNITPPSRPTVVVEVNNDFGNPLQGTKRVPIISGSRGLSIDLIADTGMGFKVSSAVFEGLYTRRSRPI